MSEAHEQLMHASLWQLGGCSVIVTRELLPGQGRDSRIMIPRWHLSIAHPRRYPTWDELGEARDRLLPEDGWFCMAHPPREFWANIHPNCLHLWQFDDPVLIEQWRWEGQHVQGTPQGQPSSSRDMTRK